MGLIVGLIVVIVVLAVLLTVSVTGNIVGWKKLKIQRHRGERDYQAPENLNQTDSSRINMLQVDEEGANG